MGIEDILFALVNTTYIFLVVKRFSDSKRYRKMVSAVSLYILDRINNDEYLPPEEFLKIYNYFDLIKYQKSMFYHVFDWGYQNYLPKDIFEIIEPYLVDKPKSKGD